MPASQLKRLKASLREQGVVGPQKSKKQKKQALRQGASKDKRIARSAALDGMREQFNPFETKTSARGSKFQSANEPGTSGTTPIGRPGVTKGLGEEAVSYLYVISMFCVTYQACSDERPYLWKCIVGRKSAESLIADLAKTTPQ